MASLRTVDGYAIDGDDMNYTTECPHCDYEIEWQGFFDADDKHICPKCKNRFYVNKVWVSENEFVQ